MLVNGVAAQIIAFDVAGDASDFDEVAEHAKQSLNEPEVDPAARHSIDSACFTDR